MKNKVIKIRKKIVKWIKDNHSIVNTFSTFVMAIIAIIMVSTLSQNNKVLRQNEKALKLNAESLNMNKKEFRLHNRPFLDVQKGLLGGEVFDRDGKSAPFSVNFALVNNSFIPATNIFVYYKLMVNGKLIDGIPIDVGSIAQGIPWKLEIPLTEKIHSEIIKEKVKIHVKIIYSGLANEEWDEYKTSFMAYYKPRERQFGYSNREYK
ncbi:MAG: hypothetical protein K9L76_00115 [Candidatus Omnitrophica bacterium]|nr:hypothetical protein [Candidatus Omnitrophota bacterium]